MWQYYTDKPYNTAIVNSESVKSKMRITGKTPVAGITKDVGTAAPLKYFWRSLEMPLLIVKLISF